jgi:basic membrane protein A
MQVRNARALAAILAVMALMLTACQPTGTSPTAGATTAAPTEPAETEPTETEPTETEPAYEPLKVGVVTDVGQLEDKSFNQSSNEGAMEAAETIGGEHAVIVTEEISDYAANIQALIDQDFDVIVTVGFLIGTDTTKAAKANPDVMFVGVDQGVCVDEAGEPDPTFACAGDAAALLPNYQGVIFAEAQPGYLAGIIAASLSESGTIGAVGGTNVPAVVNYWRGYENGAKSVNADIEVLYQETDPDPAKGFNDPARGKSIAQQQIGQGADVLFQIAGLTGQGVLEAACDADIHGIGVDVDQALTLPELEPCIVTSAEKKLKDAVSTAILGAASGAFEAGNVVYDAADEPPGIGLAPYHANEDLITPEIQAAVDEAFEGFKDGSLDPCQPVACAP